MLQESVVKQHLGWLVADPQEGEWGMRNLVEPRIRRLVADHLGVGEDELTAGLSLVEDLAADSLDLAELALVVEEDLGLAFPDAVFTKARTYGDLVDGVVGVVQAHVETETRRVAQPARVWARIVRDGSGTGRVVEHAGPLTPYAAETIADDVIRFGSGARLELTVAADADESTVARVRSEFARLTERGILVHVQRDAHGAPPQAHAVA
jgi:acyl carrier protein